MEHRPGSPTPPTQARTTGLILLALAAALLGVGWFYLWTVRPDGEPDAFSRGNRDYYNLLARGFLKGHLSLDVPADPYLATLKNPWDPAKRAGHGMHDASYFHGKYYIYFGVSPVLLLFLPIRLLSGYEIDQGMACVVFAWAGLCASAWLVGSVRRRHFPRAPAWLLVLSVAALGLTNTMPPLLRRANLWEVPITCAYACFMVALCFLYESFHGKRRHLWLALSSAAFGMAVGARPTYLPGCVALLVPLAFWIREAGGLRAWMAGRSWITALAAAILPIAAIGIGLAVYNYERFGSATEFGQTYQMFSGDGTKGGFFGLTFLAYGLRVYWLLPAHWGPYFPFVSVPDVPVAPQGQIGAEDPFGILPNLPFVVMALGVLVLAVRPRGGLNPFCLALAAATLATSATVMAFAGIANRYMVDFVPGFVVLACVGVLALAASGRARPLVCGAALLLFAYSATFNVLYSIRHNELLRNEHPALYRSMAHAWNRIPYAFERWRGRGYGDVRLSLVFPKAAAGSNEVLVCTGNSYRADFLVVHYEASNLVRFGLIHTGSGALFGAAVVAAPDLPHTVVVSMGSIYPPPGHPFFDQMSTDQALMKQEMVLVTLDGKVVLRAHALFYDATSWNPSIAGAGGKTGPFRAFSGRIVSSGRLALSESAYSVEALPYGPAQLTLRLPAFASVHSEPLLCSGEPGRGDLVYVKYLSPSQVAFGFDHWGYGGTLSPPITVDPSADLGVTIDYGALHRQDERSPEPAAGTTGRLLVTVDNRPVLDAPEAFYRCSRAMISVGENIIGASTAGSEFTGTIVKVSYQNH